MPVDRATQILIDSKLPRADFDTYVAGGGGGGGTTTLSDLGRVSLDSFQTGALSDDTLLTNALSAVAADTYPRAIQLTNRQYSFSTVNRTPFDGMRIIGPEGYGNPERLTQTKMPGRVALSGTGPWFDAGANTYYSVSLHGLSFTGGSSAYVLASSAGGQFYCLSMRDIFSSGLKSVLGSVSTKLLITAASFTGDWEINNCYNTAFHLGGSDNALWTDGCLLDSGTAFNTAGSANGQYQLWCDSLDKTYIGPMYITAEAGWNGVRISGAAYNAVTANMGSVTIYGMRLEGRNPSAGCNGSLLRVEGGRCKFHGGYINYGMVSPTTPGHSPADAGIIHHSGGRLSVRATAYDRASGVAESVPFVYSNTTGPCVVGDIEANSRSAAWTGLPQVARPIANAENRIMDATVTGTTV